MKIKLGLLVLFSVFLGGCGHATRTSGSYLGEITRHPDRYMGATISVFGTVVSVDHSDNGTRFRIATVNYAYVFDVTYPGDIPKLAHDKDAYLLAKVVGSEKSVEAYSGVIIKLNAIAVRPVGGKAVYEQQDRRIAQQWVKGKLDLSEVQTVASSQQEETDMAAAPAPQGQAQAQAQAAAPSYPGLEGLAEPVKIAGGMQPTPPAQVQISAEEAAPAPPPPAQAPVAYAPASAPPPQAQPAYAPPPPPQAPVAYAPPPPPTQAPAPYSLPPPPAPAAAIVSPPISLDRADAADLRLINGKWNDLPPAAKAEIVRQIIAHYSDQSVVSQNWRGLPDEVKAMILKQIIESAP